MLDSVNPSERMAVGRLKELLSDQSPWYRSLWGVGIVLAMEELYEACTVVKQGHLSEASVKRIIGSLQKRLAGHPVFTDNEKRFIRDQLQQIPRADGPAHYAVRDFARKASETYLSRWAIAIKEGNFRVEHFARSVASFLLDQGFSSRYFHQFIEDRLSKEEPITLPQLCEEMQAEVRSNPPRNFEALLAFASVPRLPKGAPESWLRDAAVTQWLHANGFSTAGVRSPVAIPLTVQARDAIGAAQQARSTAEKYAARAQIASGEPLNWIPLIWVEGSKEPAPMKEASRGVGVKELFREDRVFSADPSQSVDAALELLAHLEVSSPPAAIAGGWGAIEGLLADPSNRAAAADNLATLVTCSLPRAELTAISYRAQRRFPAELAALNNAKSNRERCRIVVNLIIDEKMPELTSLADRAAVIRMRKMLKNPQPWLQSIRDEIGDSFHRLYRQRNLILHGGRLDSVALHASLRTVAKLAGAGMDRITHGLYLQGVKPLELVSKANMALALVGDNSADSCVDLLEAD